ncbi:hypothetical protein LCGC14_1714190 [marine sediment metagenome]|uniref:Uncharacterized protein n=1 Tax=marine sediment metagenome TaxID=412755 RepID=A0A0F9HEU7_9ZZZZ
MTQGKKMTRRGDHGKWLNKEWSVGTKKHIYAYKYRLPKQEVKNK